MQRIDRSCLVRVQLIDAARRDAGRDLGMQGPRELPVASRTFGQNLAVDATADQVGIGRELVERRARIRSGMGPHRHRSEGTDRVRRQRDNY